MRALEGLLVVSLEQAVAAPLCTARLADAGARVIKVERPEGDFARFYDHLARGQSAYFVWLNRGKESICLDLRDTDDRNLLRRMIARADILVQNLKPGALARLGISRRALRRAHPRLIIASISGFREDGRLAGRKAYDLLIQAEAGLVEVTGTPEAPARVGVSVVDIATGLAAYQAILEALIRRGQTGEGADIRISMFDTIAEWMAVPLMQHEGGRSPGRVGVAHPSIAPYGLFAASDGAVLISVQNDREWAVLAGQFIGRPELARDADFATNAARVANRERTDALVAAAVARRSRAEAFAELEALGIAFAQASTLDDLARHPELSRITVPTPGGAVSLPAPPVGEGPFGPVPALDEHGAAIRREFAG
ncbi:MAG: CoA transferase [Alphaproteobacteria bacterium]|nr:MAG: CoA transferase [Alphaproteobacteria bacterium]